MSASARSVITIDNTAAKHGRRSAVISIPGQDPQELIFESYDGPLSVNAGDDAFLLGSLLLLMEAGHSVHVKGEISLKLLTNLNDLQTVWARWKPAKYRVVQITADKVSGTFCTDGPAICAFSGGVDASHTVYDVMRNNPLIDLQAVLFVHGFDIPLDNNSDYESARRRGETMLRDFNLHSIGLRTNIRGIGQSWEDSFGLAVASCLAIFQNAYTVGLIGSSEPYDELVFPWGSSPVTDHLYTTGRMDVRHYGAGSSRTDKMKLLSTWPAALNHLRVCWQGVRGDVNCGRCEKCVRTYLNFLAIGVTAVNCFEHLPDQSMVRRMRVGSRPQLNELKSIAKYAQRQGIKEQWVRNLNIAIAVNSLRVPLREHNFILRIARSVKKA